MTAQAHEPSYTPGLKLQGLTQAEAQEAGLMQGEVSV